MDDPTFLDGPGTFLTIKADDLTLGKRITVELTGTVKHSPPSTTLRTPDFEPL